MLAGLRRRPPELVVFVTANLDAEAIEALRACRPRSAVLVVCTGGDAATVDLRIVDARVESFPDAWPPPTSAPARPPRRATTNSPSWTSAAPSLRPVRSPRSSVAVATGFTAGHLGRRVGSRPVLGAALVPHAVALADTPAPRRRHDGCDHRRPCRVPGVGAHAVDDGGRDPHRTHARRPVASARHRAARCATDRAGGAAAGRDPARGARGVGDGRVGRLPRVPAPRVDRRARAGDHGVHLDRARSHRRQTARWAPRWRS